MAAERRRMRLLYADTIKDLLANCAIQDGERPWVWRAADILRAPVCPQPPLGSQRKETPTHWPDGPLVSRSPSGQGMFGPLAQLLGAVKMELGPEENPLLSTECIWMFRIQGIWEGTIGHGLEDYRIF